MRYSFDAAEAPTEKRHAVLRDARQPRHLARGVEGRRPSTVRSAVCSNFENDRWQLFHTDEDRSEAHDLADEHPDKVEELKALWMEEAEKPTTSCRSTTCRSSATKDLRDVHRHGVPHPGAAQRPVHVLPGHERGPRAVGRQRPRRVVQGAGRGRRHRRGRRGDLRPRAHASAATRCSSRTAPLTYAYNFLGIPPETAVLGPCPERRATTSSASSSPRSGWASTTRRTGRSSCTSTTRSSPRARSAR